ncbi:MAG: DNA polymerase II large subunit, partial [Candidatus Marsarchaeota archaeon]|nr:DNA polymerase II large subunit [Candidatus Marsarchaeota archaeon]
MDSREYFSMLSEGFEDAFEVAKKARLRGLDPKDTVEIIPASDLAGRVQGLIGINGIDVLIRKNHDGKTRNALAFAVVKEICTGKDFDIYDRIKRIELAVRVGTAVITEGVLVAPTEGISSVASYKNQDGTSCIAVLYAGPIRGAGGSSAALSVALADYARQLLGIGEYKPTKDEIERYVEEIELYHTRCARLQYRPSDDDIRSIISSCPVCIDGVPTEEVEVGVHANMKRTMADGSVVPITNRVRGGVALVSCEGIAQKAKKILKETKNAGLEWGWLNKVIKADVKKSDDINGEKTAVFLEELVAGRPVISYPGRRGGLRLRYGRSRFTGIAAKGVSPATMIIADSFIAIGTQMKVELPGKGCVAMPVDTIEGPFVRLKSGEALRINTAEQARAVKNDVDEIISLGDILITYGDFRKTNTKLQPSSYVEELWELQLKNAGGVVPEEMDFMRAYALSLKHGIPIHP